MWVFTLDGFFSAVQKDCGKDELMVRARSRADIERLCQKLDIPHTKISEYHLSDYQFRVPVRKEAFSKYLASEAEAIDYDNFKDSVPHDETYRPRVAAYMKCWSAMNEFQYRVGGNA